MTERLRVALRMAKRRLRLRRLRRYQEADAIRANLLALDYEFRDGKHGGILLDVRPDYAGNLIRFVLSDIECSRYADEVEAEDWEHWAQDNAGEPATRSATVEAFAEPPHEIRTWRAA